MIGLLNVIKAGWALLTGWVAGLLLWLRRPGSPLKIGCAVLAFGCLVSGLSAFEREQRIKELSAQVVQIQKDWDADAARLHGDVAERDRRLADIAATLRAEAAKLEALKAESAKALKALASKIEASESDAATWRARYEQRPDTCKAALELLDSACPALKGY